MLEKQDLLLVDISNSHTKMIKSSYSSLCGEVFSLPTNDLDLETLNLVPLEIQKEETIIVFSSVVPEKNKFIEDYFGIHRVLRVSTNLNLGFNIEYPQPESIGADRIANVVAAIHLTEAPVVVVDFGTAVTFDVITKENKYIGGVISPGLSAMADYMADRTALLPKIDLNEPLSVIGKSTKEAMLSGAVIGYRGLVKGILLSIFDELGEANIPVIATGGYSKLISSNIEEIVEVNEKLTLEGLRIIAALNTQDDN
ncbi:MAG: type III pantothenate kinase [Verrucomicrobiaceae bacterium]|nr:type III pantothenate kinase [Verrucomicrobiaceae bacterium]|tara:strand:+ start:131 stop:895 length:765 start_codon:yes stop_codon:yes gene_type:complete